MQTQVIHDHIKGALEGRTSFLATVKALIGIEVERYYTDLVRMEKVFYAKNGESCIERLPISARPELAEAFDSDALKATLVEVQHRRIDYPEFLRRSLRAGCTSYVVYIDGLFTVYFGRKGETLVEPIPLQSP